MGEKDERRPGTGAAALGTSAREHTWNHSSDARPAASILADRPLAGWILPSRSGTFELLADFEPGALRAEFLHVPGDDGEIVDAIAWERERPGIWWTRHDLLTHVGWHELEAAWWEERPARLLETPNDYVARLGAGFVILDWTADLDAIIGRVARIECATQALKARLKQKLVERAMRGLSITTCAPGLRRAA